MAFSRAAYSVLVVSSAQQFNDVLLPMLPRSDDSPVRVVNSIAAARRELAEKGYDFVIINAPLPDDCGTRFAMDASTGSGTVVLLLLRAEACEEVRARVVPHGVFLLPKPTSIQTLQQSLGWMASARERLRQPERRALAMEEKLEQLRLVNRAKWVLIEQRSMTEAEAHRHIEKLAMDRCRSKKEIALEIIRGGP